VQTCSNQGFKNSKSMRRKFFSCSRIIGNKRYHHWRCLYCRWRIERINKTISISYTIFTWKEV